jgi:hypothetical protein
MEFMLLPVARSCIALVAGATLLGSCASPTPAASAPKPPDSSAQAATPVETAEAPSRTDDSQGSPQPEARLAPPSPVDDAGSPLRKSPDAAPEPEPTVPPGTKVLHIGDSMAGALGIELNQALKEAGAKGILRYKTASFIPTWAWSRDLPVLLANHNPDLVLITLGTNEIRIEDPTIRAKTVRKLVGRLEGRPCVWIAPPLWGRGDTGLLPVIRENCAPCIFMDTNALLPDSPRLRDKVHPTMKARHDWAQFVLDWLVRQRDPNGKRPWDMKPVAASASGPKQ